MPVHQYHKSSKSHECVSSGEVILYCGFVICCEMNFSFGSFHALKLLYTIELKLAPKSGWFHIDLEGLLSLYFYETLDFVFKTMYKWKTSRKSFILEAALNLCVREGFNKNYDTVAVVRNGKLHLMITTQKVEKI